MDVHDGAFVVSSAKDDKFEIGDAAPSEMVKGAEEVFDEFGSDAVFFAVKHHESDVSASDVRGFEEMFEDGFAQFGGRTGEVSAPVFGALELWDLCGEARILSDAADHGVCAVDIRVHIEAAKGVGVVLEELGKVVEIDVFLGDAFDGSEGKEEVASVSPRDTDHALFIASIDARAFAVTKEGSETDPADICGVTEVHLDITAIEVLSGFGGALKLGVIFEADIGGFEGEDALEDAGVSANKVSHALPLLHAAVHGGDKLHPEHFEVECGFSGSISVIGDKDDGGVGGIGLCDQGKIRRANTDDAGDMAQKAEQFVVIAQVKQSDAAALFGDEFGGLRGDARGGTFEIDVPVDLKQASGRIDLEVQDLWGVVVHANPPVDAGMCGCLGMRRTSHS